jgi:hypothetical protein
MSAEALRFTEADLLPVLITIFEIILIVHLVIKVPVVIYKAIQLIRWPAALPLNSASNDQR